MRKEWGLAVLLVNASNHEVEDVASMLSRGARSSEDSSASGRPAPATATTGCDRTTGGMVGSAWAGVERGAGAGKGSSQGRLWLGREGGSCPAMAIQWVGCSPRSAVSARRCLFAGAVSHCKQQQGEGSHKGVPKIGVDRKQPRPR